MDIIKFLEEGGKQYLPNLSIDHVIIGYEDSKLKCLLLRITDKWVLPGGYIQFSESVEHAAVRILKERTGLENPHQKFLSVFGETNRKFKNQWKAQFLNAGIPWKEDYWINNRFVTLAYYSLVDMKVTAPVAGEYHDEIAWFDFADLPEMWMDHKSIAMEARNRLKDDIKREHIVYNLLPKQFTMPDLHQLHQDILEQEVERSRFQKKMLGTGIFERLPKLQKETPGRNPYLYQIKE